MLFPSRMPVCMAPVWLVKSVSQPVTRCVPLSSQRLRFGIKPSSMARRKICSPRPSISRNMNPGTSVRMVSLFFFAIRWVTSRSKVASSSSEKTAPRIALTTVNQIVIQMPVTQLSMLIPGIQLTTTNTAIPLKAKVRIGYRYTGSQEKNSIKMNQNAA